MAWRLLEYTDNRVYSLPSGRANDANATEKMHTMTPELIIALEVCLKAGNTICGSVFPGDGGTNARSGRDVEVFRLIGRSLSVAGLPVLGSCSEPVSFSVRSGWRRFWLVSVKVEPASAESRRASLTVGVALIDGNEPVVGVMYSTASNELYCASRESGAFRVRNASHSFAETARLSFRTACSRCVTRGPARLLVDGRFVDERMLACIEELGHEYPDIRLVRGDGGMNICLVAAGDAELYPKIDPSAEWETAPGHAILKATGRRLVDLGTGCELTYNKPEMVNPRCIAC